MVSQQDILCLQYDGMECDKEEQQQSCVADEYGFFGYAEVDGHNFLGFLLLFLKEHEMHSPGSSIQMSMEIVPLAARLCLPFAHP